MITIIRDLSDEIGMMADTFAVLAFAPTLNKKQQYIVAAGRAADEIYSGVRPLKWFPDASGSQDESNSSDDFADWFDTVDQAEKYIKSMRISAQQSARRDTGGHLCHADLI